MKKSVMLFSVLLLLFIFQRCNPDEDVAPSAKTKVTFDFSSPGDINGRKKTDISESTTLVVSIETSTGESVLSHHSLTLLSFGDGYVTEPIDLFPGNYVITDFMLVDNSDVLFVTPHTGSSLAALVKHPLPYGFRVERNKLHTINMQVVEVEEHGPEDFGYASFHIDVVRPLPFAVFTMGKTIKLTSAKAYLLKDADTVEVYSLGAKVNILSFKHDPHETYRLVIQKDGYAAFSKTFVYDELIAEMNGHPLNAYLQPALTMTLSVNPFAEGYPNNSGYVTFRLSASSDANVTIDWGDGVIQQLPIDASVYYTTVWHVYNNGSYYIGITGDLEKITDYSILDLERAKLKINFDNLSELKVVNLLWAGNNIDVLDIRKNKKIEHIVFGGNTLLLPDESNLRIVVVFGEGIVPSLDYIIDNVYTNTVNKNIFDGSLEIDDHPDSGNPIGNPSDESRWKIEQLTTLYGWQFYPGYTN
ncbi:MAG: hypothetical protein ABI663_20930 [Chryseolinea sp.]